jgi:hypothetical protein
LAARLTTSMLTWQDSPEKPVQPREKGKIRSSPFLRST